MPGRFLATPDRGPSNGTVDQFDRAQVIDVVIAPDGSGGYTITPRLAAAKFLHFDATSHLSGLSSLFDPTNSPAGSRRFDPEGVRMDATGLTFRVSDEYGSFLYQFRASDRQRIRSVQLPPGIRLSRRFTGAR